MKLRIQKFAQLIDVLKGFSTATTSNISGNTA